MSGVYKRRRIIYISISAISNDYAKTILKSWFLVLCYCLAAECIAQDSGLSSDSDSPAVLTEDSTLVSGVQDCGEEVCFEEVAVPNSQDNRKGADPSIVEEQSSESGVGRLDPASESAVTQPEPSTSEQVDLVEDDTTRRNVDEDTQKEFRTQDSDELSDSESTDVDPRPRDRPGLFVVDEDAAERALERSLVLLDALLLQPRRGDVGVDFSYAVDSRLGSSLIAVTDEDSGETSDFIGVVEEEDKSISSTVDIRIGLPGDSQLNLAIPFANTTSTSRVRLEGAVVEAQQDDTSQNGDFTLSYIKTVFTEKGRRPDLIAGIAYSNASDSTGGSGASDVTVSLNATKRQDPLVFTGSVSLTQSGEKDGFEAGSRRSLSVGALLAASPYTSLQFSFDHTMIGSSVINGVKISGSGQDIANANIGVASVIGQRLFLNGNLAIGLSEFSSDYVLSLGLSRRFSF